MSKVNFSFTADDYIAANQLNMRLVYFSRRGLRALVIIWIFYFTIALAFTGEWTLLDTAILAIATALGSLLIAVTLIGVNALLLPHRSKRLFLQQKSLEGVFEAHWDAEQIVFLSPRGDGRHPWHHFVKAAENNSVMMLYQSDILYNMIPKRVLDESMLADIRQALSAHNVRLYQR